MRPEILAIAIVFVSVNTGTNAFFHPIVTSSRTRALFSQQAIIEGINAQWSPHMVLGEEKMGAFSTMKQEEDEQKKDNETKVREENEKSILEAASIAEKENADAVAHAAKVATLAAAEQAKVAASAAAALAVKEEQAKVAAAASAAVAAKEEQAKVAAAAEQAKVAAAAAAAAVAVKEEQAKAAAAASAVAVKAEDSAEEETSIALSEEENEAEEAMLIVAENLKKEAEDAKAASVAKKQEELARLAAVASRADALEKEESESQSNALKAEGKSVIESLLTGDKVSTSVTEEMDVFDIMQASAEAEASKGSGESAKLEVAITILAKAPMPRLRRLITKYKPDLLPDLVSTTLEDSALQAHLKASLEALWSNSDGSWEKLMTTLNEELGKQAEETSLWMKASLIAANQLSETRLKTLIRQYGGIDSMPKLKNGSTEKMDKTVLVAALVDVLRENNENDYSKVAPILQLENTKGGGKKGFSSAVK